MSIELNNLSVSGNVVLGPLLRVDPPGQIEFITPGSYLFTVPDGVSTISFVAIGAGAYGSFTQSASGNGQGGPGGGLAYRTASVTPGQTIYANVGLPLETENAYQVGAQGAHGNSNVNVGGVITTATGGNKATLAGGYPAGSYDGGGYGGPGGSKYDAVNGILGGGGGAGGYGANGGGGGAWGGEFAANTAGSLGGGNGGNYYYGYYNAFISAGGGGGANIYGPSIPGQAGTPGGDTGATLGQGGNYGGGGGSLRYPQYTGGTTPGMAGKSGAIRIIWGSNRFYPNTNVQDVIS